MKLKSHPVLVGKPKKTVYMAKIYSLIVRSHLRWGTISPRWNEFILIYFFRKWNLPFCWNLNQVSYPTEVRQLTSYKPPPSITKDILCEINANLFCCFIYVNISKTRRKKILIRFLCTWNSLNIQEKCC